MALPIAFKPRREADVIAVTVAYRNGFGIRGCPLRKAPQYG
jgi:hypothetical protein